MWLNLLKSFSFFLCLIVSSSLFVSQAEASIVLKLVAANPSKEQVQKVQVKAYLPKEAKPEDVIDKGDLDIAYDTQQGSYFVYGEYELKPGELLEKDIEMRDIWVIPVSDIEFLRLETQKLTDLLKNTEFSDRVSFLKNNIDSKLNQIMENQKNSPPNPERHISDYRDNLKIMDSIKADLALIRGFLSQVKPMPMIVVWRLLIAIVMFLGLLGISFYFVWQKQLKVITTPTFGTEGKSESVAIQGEKREAKEEKKMEAEDIEKIIEDGDL